MSLLLLPTAIMYVTGMPATAATTATATAINTDTITIIILGLAAGAGNAAAKHLARVACQDANSEPKKTPRCS